MPADPLKILLIEDNPGDARLISEMLAAASCDRFALEVASNLADGINRLSLHSFAAVLLDLTLGDTSGIDTFRAIHSRAPDVPVVVLTGSNDDALATEALQAGAQDYLVKGAVDRNLLARSLRYAVERGRIERELRRHALELADAGRRKDEFLAILSHELRNPLFPLIHALQILREPGLEDSRRQWAQDVADRQVTTITRLIDDLLDVSRISRGKLTLRKEPMDLAAAVRRAVETTRPLFADRRHHLTFTLPDHPVTIEGDPIRIEQVITNLLTNAAKYTPAGGTEDSGHTNESLLAAGLAPRDTERSGSHNASVHAGGAPSGVSALGQISLTLTTDPDSHFALISVRDNGLGIPPDMLERIFELFTRIDSSTDRTIQWGMGVGLALARTFVQLHGGSIHATSPGPNQGSTFLVRLPLSPSSRSQIPDPKSQILRSSSKSETSDQTPDPTKLELPSTPFQIANRQSPIDNSSTPLRVLIVEDHEDSAQCLAAMLQIWNHQVRIAPDGPTALQLAPDFLPHIILLDIGLPGMDGYHVARQLRAQPQFHSTTLIALTGYGRAEDRQLALQAGFNSHLTKPIDPQTLENLLTAHSQKMGTGPIVSQ